jgi:hypothetical protein
MCIDWNNDNFEIEAAAGLRKNERIENLRPKLVGWEPSQPHKRASAHLHLSFSLRPPENPWKAAAAPCSTWRRLRQRFRLRRRPPISRLQRRSRALPRQRGPTSCTGSGPSGTTSSRSPSPAPRGAPRSRRPTPSTPSRSSGGICATAFGTIPPGFLPDPFGSDLDAVLRPFFRPEENPIPTETNGGMRPTSQFLCVF